MGFVLVDGRFWTNVCRGWSWVGVGVFVVPAPRASCLSFPLTGEGNTPSYVFSRSQCRVRGESLIDGKIDPK